MKLRINGNSIRLRLNPHEVTTLCNDATITSHTTLLNGLFNYELKTGSHWHAEVIGSSISVSMPYTLVEDWAENKTVGFEHEFGNGLLVLVEKDFQCLHPRKHENEEHLYPNPEKH